MQGCVNEEWVYWNSLTRDNHWSARKIDENYFFLAFRLVINYPNHRSLSHILGFAVTVAIWPKEVVVCRNFILGSVATFWVMSLVGIYPGRASSNMAKLSRASLMDVNFVTSGFIWHSSAPELFPSLSTTAYKQVFSHGVVNWWNTLLINCAS